MKDLQTFEEWSANYDIDFPMPLMGNFIYNGIECALICTSEFTEKEDGRLSKPIITLAKIRPKNSQHDIGKGAGMMELVYFKTQK